MPRWALPPRQFMDDTATGKVNPLRHSSGMPASQPPPASPQEEAVLHRRIDELTLHANRIDPTTDPTPIVETPVLDGLLVAVRDDPHTDLALGWANDDTSTIIVK